MSLSRTSLAVAAFGALGSAVIGILRKRARTFEPLQWLENPTSELALKWVRKQNEHCFSQRDFGNARDSPVYNRILGILDNKDKIPYVSKIGDLYYNFWQDDQHIRGVWRRTTMEEYRKSSPKWEVVLDIDDLNKKENTSWVWKGYTKHEPLEGEEFSGLCLIDLSPGGGDATVVREFNVLTKSFVSQDDANFPAFYVPEAKTYAEYKTRDVLLIGTDVGAGSLTSSGYPRVAKEWKRGTPLSSAKTIFEGENSDVSAYATTTHTRGYSYEWHHRSTSFYTSKKFVKVGESGDFVQLDVPDDMKTSVFGKYFLFRLRSDWNVNGTAYRSGSMLFAVAEEFHGGNKKSLTPLFQPTDRCSLSSFSCTKNVILLEILDNVKTRYEFHRYTEAGFELDAALGNSLSSQVGNDVINLWAVEKHENDRFWMSRTGFITPSSLLIGDAEQNKNASTARSPELLKTLPALFDASEMTVNQYHAISKDGTIVPYFEVSKATGSPGPRPTLLYGYGGFEISLLPSYRAVSGAAWLERGGVYVMANIRGGGEFGPKWHQAALKEKRHRAYEDFEAVGEDLIRRNVTTNEKLACMGGSNGGLLVGNMLVRRPDLWGAVVCMVPLLDMRRYNRLLAGASWMAEYGNPDIPEEWEYIKHFSPYHMLEPGVKYPPVLFTTSTKDDRVCPSHARKMVRKMNDMGLGEQVYYYENIEGGHGGAADNKQSAFMWALCYEFLASKLGLSRL